MSVVSRGIIPDQSKSNYRDNLGPGTEIFLFPNPLSTTSIG